MSTTLFTLSRRCKPAGVFLFCLFLFIAPTYAAEDADICLAGYPSVVDSFTEAYPYHVNKNLETATVLTNTSLQKWLSTHRWHYAYSHWQQSRLCKSALISGNACTVDNAPVPVEEKCGGAQDGYDFLVMHRYLLQTLKGLRPELEQHLSRWKKFPLPQHYPQEIQSQVHAWPDEVIRAAAIADTLSKTNADDIAQRWPTEGDFGRWLQCGADGGLGVDTIYSTLISNAIEAPVDDPQAIPHIMDLYLFWQVHGWIDLAWEKYRRALGKMPDEPQLQAALIQQCRVFQFWTKKTAQDDKSAYAQSPELYQNGNFNALYKNKLAKIMGQVEEIKTDANARVFIRVDPRLVGVNNLWASADMPLNIESIKVGDRFYFIGTIVRKEDLEKSKRPQFIESSTLMLVSAIQSIK